MARTLVTLDPEYIPWAPQTPNVALRRHHNKLLEAALPIVIGILVMGGIWLFVNRGNLSQGDGAKSAVAGDVATPTAGEVAVSGDTSPAAADLLITGNPGHLGLRRGQAVTFLPCRTYTVTVGAQTFTGDTAAGPVVLCDGETQVICDGAQIDF